MAARGRSRRQWVKASDLGGCNLVSTPTLQVGDVVAGRFRVERTVAGNTIGRVVQGQASESAAEVVLVPLSAAELSVLRNAEAAHHPQLASILAVEAYAEGGILVAEYVLGETLAERLQAVGRKRPLDAVRSTLRLADAAAALHRLGAVHGGVCAEAVILNPPGRDGPLLCFQGPRGGVFSPQSDAGISDGVAPTDADDAWAISVLLHRMLLGEPPPAAGVSDEGELELEDSRLRAVLLHGLNTDPTARAVGLKPLMGELARWFVDHAGDESVPSIRTSVPPPLPGLAAAPVNLSIDPPRESEGATKGRLGRVLAFALVASALGLGGAWVYSSVRKAPVLEVAVPAETNEGSVPGAASAAAAGPEKPAIDLGEVAVMGSAGVPGADPVSTCVSEYLGATTDELAWVCGEADALEGSSKLRVAVVKGSKGIVNDGMRLMSQVGWHEFVVYASVRRACCPDATSVKLPAASAGCEDLGKISEQVAEAAVSGKPLATSLDAFEKAANCEAQAGKSGNFRKTARADSAGRAQFETFAARFQRE